MNIKFKDTLEKENKIYIDVRSPKEYQLEKIPQAINIPVLLDDERKIVGILYKNGQKDKSRLYGIRCISKRLEKIVEKIMDLKKKYNNIFIYCQRGGYRSSSIVNLLEGIGIYVYKIENGYKGYRKYINDNLENLIKESKFITLYGNTGVGKTSILKEIEALGGKVLDLEEIANHKGSILGIYGNKKQNSQKDFESLLFFNLLKNKGSFIFTEGESKRIGKIIMPDILYKKIQLGPLILINSDLEFRVKEIKDTYLKDFNNNKGLILETVNKLSKYISKERMENYINLVIKEDYINLIKDLCINYYDLNYKMPNKNFDKIYKNEDSRLTAKLILNDFKKKN